MSGCFVVMHMYLLYFALSLFYVRLPERRFLGTKAKSQCVSRRLGILRWRQHSAVVANSDLFIERRM